MHKIKSQYIKRREEVRGMQTSFFWKAVAIKLLSTLIAPMSCVSHLLLQLQLLNMSISGPIGVQNNNNR